MTPLLWIIASIGWLVLGIFNFYKQTLCLKENDDWKDVSIIVLFFLTVLAAPIFFVGAIIRQTITEPWR